jgi:hypothetical protein
LSQDLSRPLSRSGRGFRGGSRWTNPPRLRRWNELSPLNHRISRVLQALSAYRVLFFFEFRSFLPLLEFCCPCGVRVLHQGRSLGDSLPIVRCLDPLAFGGTTPATSPLILHPLSFLVSLIALALLLFTSPRGGRNGLRKILHLNK